MCSAPSPPEAAAHAGKAGSITPSPSPAARSQTTLTNFFKLKGASGPRPAVAAPPGLAGSEWMKKADEGAEQRDTAGGHGHIPGSPAPSSEQRDTAGSGGLIPSSFVSFCEDPSRKGGFTPVYESADGSYADFAGMASLNAGAFRLYVGGAAINRLFWPASCNVPSPPLALPPFLLAPRRFSTCAYTTPALVMKQGLCTDAQRMRA